MKNRAILKFVCPVCNKEFIASSIVKQESEYHVTCIHCNEKLSIDIIEDSEIDAFIENNESCPKCGAVRLLDDISCAKCGLVYEKWKGEKKLFSDYPELKKEWKSLKKVPIDSEKHFVFLEKCFNVGALHSAVRAYKILGAKQNIDVSKKIGQLNILAQMSMSKNSSKKNRSSLKFIFMIIISLLFIGICFYLLSINPEDLL